MRRFVLCLDGTWNNPNTPKRRQDGTRIIKPANPLKVARAIKDTAADGTPQITYYDAGVGGLSPYRDLGNKLLGVVDRGLGGALGAGFEGNVEDAYLFLANNVCEEDEVYVFGFSRGASQARALCHFLDWMGGVPHKRDAFWIPEFFATYVGSRGQQPAAGLKARLGSKIRPFRPIGIRFLGLWDSVLSLGLRRRAADAAGAQGNTFFLHTEPPHVGHAVQALAIDEGRWDFRPEVWHRPAFPGQTLEQQWFPGAHSNVGGGYVDDGLANNALHWVLCKAVDLGLEVDCAFLKPYRGFAGDDLRESRTGFYKVIEALRGRVRRNVRVLVPEGVDRMEAGIGLHPSVFHRMNNRDYRPSNVLDYMKAYDVPGSPGADSEPPCLPCRKPASPAGHSGGAGGLAGEGPARPGA